jgi:hypothetical protein
MTAGSSIGSRALTAALYGVAVLFVTNPIADVVLQTWPIRPAQAEWRYGTIGIGANYLASALLGMLLAVLAATWRGHLRILRVLGVLAVLGAATLVAASATFSLDVLQLRHSVPDDARWGYKVGASKALFKYATSALVTALIGIGSWRAGRASRSSSAPEDAPALVRVGGA